MTNVIPNSLNVTIGEDIEIQPEAETTTRTYKVDFENGRISGFVDESEAMQQAIYKILLTERFDYLIYSWNYGIEMKALFGKSYPVVESEVKRVIREALMADSRITDARDFNVSRVDKRTVSVSFTAITIFGDIPVETEVNA